MITMAQSTDSKLRSISLFSLFIDKSYNFHCVNVDESNLSQYFVPVIEDINLVWAMSWWSALGLLELYRIYNIQYMTPRSLPQCNAVTSSE